MCPIAEPTIVRDENGKFKKSSVEELENSVVEQMQEDPGMFARILAKVKNSPIASKMAERNQESMKLAAKAKVGGILLGRIRQHVIAPNLPVIYQPAMDNPLIAGAVDLGVANILLFGTELVRERLPESMREYSQIATDALVYAAWNNTANAVDIEGLIKRTITGDVMSMLDGLKSK